jgi:hypothetical protein
MQNAAMTALVVNCRRYWGEERLKSSLRTKTREISIAVAMPPTKKQIDVSQLLMAN